MKGLLQIRLDFTKNLRKKSKLCSMQGPKPPKSPRYHWKFTFQKHKKFQSTIPPKIRRYDVQLWV